MHTTVELLICDLDGTLIASDTMWFHAARRAVTRYHERRGSTGALPVREVTDGMIGEPPGAAFARLVPEDADPDLGLLEDLAREEEALELARGEDLAIPGAREVLREFRRQGGKVAVASNCDTRYLALALPAGRFEELVDLPLCIDPTRDRHTKADLVREALDTFGTRRAVMLGDRAFDADAARAHGVPFFGRIGGYAKGDADRRAFEEAEGHFTRWQDVPALLERRVRTLDELLGAVLEMGCLRVGVTGPRGVGRSTFAEELRERARVRFGLSTPVGPGSEASPTRPADGVLEVADGTCSAGAWSATIRIERAASSAQESCAETGTRPEVDGGAVDEQPRFAWFQERIHAPRWRREA
ncbi:MAG: HAD family hydrolase [Planctomycetes bacterium]|nr:HAD family hydrolase [Planctomycetota bacterium]